MIQAEMRGVSRVGVMKGFAHIAVWQEEENRQALEERDSRKYRELAARANYLAHDRMDIQFANSSEHDKRSGLNRSLLVW